MARENGKIDKPHQLASAVKPQMAPTRPLTVNLMRESAEENQLATILIRAWFTEESFRNRLDATVSRSGAVRELLSKMDMNLINVYWSSTEACAITLCEGDASNIPAIEMIYMATGGYTHCRSEILHTEEEMAGHRQRARKLFPSFDAPNRDEIDRMLLDE